VAMELKTVLQPVAYVALSADQEIEVPAGHWIQYRHGTPEAPVDDLVAQVPAGKKWVVIMTVGIRETDA